MRIDRAFFGEGKTVWHMVTQNCHFFAGVVHYVLGRIFQGTGREPFHGATEQFLRFIGAAMKMTMMRIQCPRRSQSAEYSIVTP